MKLYGVSVLAILVVGLSICGQDRRAHAPEPVKQTNSSTGALSEDDLIRSVVFRPIIEGRTQSGWLYLAVDADKDPGENLLKELSKLSKRLKKVSESAVSDEEGSAVLDINTGEKGDRLWVSKLKFVSKDEVKVSGGTYSGNMGSDGCLYTLKRVNNLWEIVSKTKCYTS